MKYLLIILICLFSFFSKAQTTFERVYSDSGITSAYDITTTFDGGYAVTGFKTCGSFGCLDFFLLKLDSLGNQEWVRLYDAGFNDDDNAYSVKQTSDSGFVLAGLVGTPPNLMNNVRLMKTDKNGNKLWDRNYGGLGCQEGWDMQITFDGGFIIATQQDTTGNCFGSKAGLIKTDSNGLIEWEKIYFNVGEGRSVSVKQTNDTGYVVTGVANNMISSTSNNDIFLVKTDKYGNEQWVKFYGNEGTERGEDVIVTSDGGFVIAGYTTGVSSLIAAYIIKTNNIGDTIWTGTYEPATNQNVLYSLIESENGYVLSGYTINPNSAGYLLKINNNGTKVWERDFQSMYGIQSLVLAQDGGYVMCGMSSGGVYVIKTDTNGLVVGINEIIPINAVAVNVYPNPFTISTTIDLTELLQANNSITIALFDLTGKLLVEETTTSALFTLYNQNYPKGMYLLTLKNNTQIIVTKKLIIH